MALLELGIEAIGTFVDAILAHVADISIDHLADKLYWPKTIQAFYRNLKEDSQAFSASEGGESFILSDAFFSSPKVQKVFAENVRYGTWNDVVLTRIFIDLYGEENQEVCQRNLEIAKEVWRKTVIDQLPSEFRASFQLLYNHIEREFNESRKQWETIGKDVRAIRREIATPFATPGLDEIEGLHGEYKSQLEEVKQLIDSYQPSEALKRLQALQSRAWEQMGKDNQYTIYAYIGFCHTQLTNFNKANEFFQLALKLKPKRSMALANAALGCLLVGDKINGAKKAQEALEEDPMNEKAVVYMIQANAEDTPFDEILKAVPERFIDSSDVNSALGREAYLRGDIETAISRLRIAIKNDRLNRIEFKASLADFIIISVDGKRTTMPGEGFINPNKDLLDEAILLYTYCWKLVEKSFDANLHVNLLLNRGIAKAMLNDKDGASTDFDNAATLDSTSPALLHNQGRIALDKREWKKAKKLYSKALEFEGHPIDSKYWLAIATWCAEEKETAIKLLQELYAECLADPRKFDLALLFEVGRLLVVYLLNEKKAVDATNLAKEMLQNHQDSIEPKVILSLIHENQKEFDEARKLLYSAAERIREETDYSSRLMIVEVLSNIGEYQLAAEILDPIVNPTVNDLPVRHLAFLYYQAGTLGKALHICRSVRENVGITRELCLMEMAILEATRDYEALLQLSTEFLLNFPQDVSGYIPQLLSYYHLSKTDKAKLLLDELYLQQTSDLEFQDIQIVVGISILLGNYEAALRTAYEYLLANQSSEKVQLYYIQTFTMLAVVLKDWLDREYVSLDSTITIERDQEGKSHNITFETKKENSQAKHTANHPLFKLLEGKKAGETIKQNDQVIIIIRVKNKFAERFSDCLTAFDLNFPLSTGVMRIPVEKVPSTISLPEKVKEILDSRELQDRLIGLIYQAGGQSIGQISNFGNQSPMALLGKLQSNPGIGVRIASGALQERLYAIKLAESTKSVAVDITALITLFELDKLNLLFDKYDHVYVAKSTIDELENILVQRPYLGDEDHLSLAKFHGEIVSLRQSREDVKSGRKNLEQLIGLIKENCEVPPVYHALTMSRSRRDELNNEVQTIFADTVLIAADKKCPIYTDDFWLRVWAEQNFQVVGFWTQVLLYIAATSESISKLEYYQTTNRLTTLGFYPVAIDAENIRQAGEKEEWKSGILLRKVLSMLSGKNSPSDIAVRIVIDFLKNHRKNVLIPPARVSNVMNLLLDQLTAMRDNRNQVIRILEDGLQQAFQLDPLFLDEVTEIIQQWQRFHLAYTIIESKI